MLKLCPLGLLRPKDPSNFCPGLSFSCRVGFVSGISFPWAFICLNSLTYIQINFQSMVEKALLFVRSSRYINASRISPDELSGRPVYTSGFCVEICTGGRTTAIFFSPCLIRASYLHRYHPSLGFTGHYITGLLHVLELDRLISMFGMVMNEDALLMQIWADALTFGTMSQGAGA